MNLPKSLIEVLHNNNAVAEPGKEKAWLHPRIEVDKFDTDIESLEVPDNICYSGLLLEAAIDKAEYPPELIGSSPDFENFSEFYDTDILSYVIKPKSYSINEGYTELNNAFVKRLAEDNGEKVKENDTEFEQLDKNEDEK